MEKKERIRIVGNLVLVLLGLAVMGYYTTCKDSCAYLQGAILGLDLKYVGFIFLPVVGILAILRQWTYLRAVLAGALGVELYLVGFQIRESVYCPYCLAIGAIIVLAFIANYERPESMHGTSFLGMVRFPWPRRLGPIPLSLFVLAGFLFVWLTFSGSVLPAYGAENDGSIPTFGTGSNEVRVYADYFCPPCGALEPAIEESLLRLVKAGKYRVTFVDVPLHKETILYARQYLYACNTGVGIAEALRVRHVLFQQARGGVNDESALIKVLSAQSIRTEPYDLSQTLRAMSRLIREDSVKDTPCCVIITSGEKKKYVGSDEVRNALAALSRL